MSIALEHVNYTYNPGTAFERHALKDINLEIGEGEFVGVIGHTGSGKSTLIQHFNGLLKPQSGSVFYDGEDIYAKDYDLKKLRSHVGIVFQYPEDQLFETDVLSDVCFGPKNLGLSTDECVHRAQESLEAVGFPKACYGQSPFELSGGQKRLAAIAGVLAMRPEMLVLDEPTAGLDPCCRCGILEHLSALQKDRGITVVLVSHRMEDIARYTQRIVVMNEGEKMLDGPSKDIFSRFRLLEKVGLAAPQVTYILQALKDRGMEVETDASTIEEAAEAIMRSLHDKGYDDRTILPGAKRAPQA